MENFTTMTLTSATTSATTSNGGVRVAARVQGSVMSNDVRDRSAAAGHLGLTAPFAIADAPGDHAWSPPRC